MKEIRNRINMTGRNNSHSSWNFNEQQFLFIYRFANESHSINPAGVWTLNDFLYNWYVLASLLSLNHARIPELFRIQYGMLLFFFFLFLLASCMLWCGVFRCVVLCFLNDYAWRMIRNFRWNKNEKQNYESLTIFLHFSVSVDSNEKKKEKFLSKFLAFRAIFSLHKSYIAYTVH